MNKYAFAWQEQHTNHLQYINILTALSFSQGKSLLPSFKQRSPNFVDSYVNPTDDRYVKLLKLRGILDPKKVPTSR